MSNQLFEKSVLNSPYEYPYRHWELDATGQPTQKIIEIRRPAEFIALIPKAKKQKGGGTQDNLLSDDDLTVWVNPRSFDKPKSGRIAVKVINHLGDEVMKVFKVS